LFNFNLHFFNQIYQSIVYERTIKSQSIIQHLQTKAQRAVRGKTYQSSVARVWSYLYMHRSSNFYDSTNFIYLM
jgi:hypothetical protein